MLMKTAIKRGKATRVLMIAALCFVGWGQMSDSVIVPLTTSIYHEFPDSSLFLKNFVLSGSCLIAVPSALVSGVLSRYISKKKLLLISIVLFMAGGIGGYFCSSMEMLAIMRAIDGASDGICVTLVCTLISELFKDEKLKSNVFGWNQSVSAVFGIAMSMFSGWMAVTAGWRTAFLIHVLDLITLILVYCFIPETPIPQRNESHRLRLYTPRKNIWCIAVNILVYLAACVMCSLVYYTVDLYVAETAIGNSMVSGSIASLSTIGMFIFDIVFGYIYVKTRRFLPVLFSLSMAVNFALLAFSKSLIPVFGSTIFYSFGVACTTPYFQMVISEKSAPEDTGIFMSGFIALNYLCGFICPYVIELIGRVSGNYTVRFTYYICMISTLIIMAGFLVRALMKKWEVNSK